jgi:hypothetical protein
MALKIVQAALVANYKVMTLLDIPSMITVVMAGMVKFGGRVQIVISPYLQIEGFTFTGLQI